MVRFEFPRSERRDQLRTHDRRIPDVQDVRTLSACVVWARLDIQANQPSLRIPLPEFRPLSNNAVPRPRPWSTPRLVVRDEDDQIRLRLRDSEAAPAHCSSCRLRRWKRSRRRSSSTLSRGIRSPKRPPVRTAARLRPGLSAAPTRQPALPRRCTARSSSNRAGCR